MDKKRAIEIYVERDPTLDDAIKFIKSNWWWISIVGERIYTWIINKIKKKKSC